MAAIIMRAGYDFFERFQFYLNGEADTALASATIECSVKNQAKSAELITDTAQTNSGTGVSWASGIVGIVFPAASTTALSPGGAWIEVAVVLGGQRLPYPDIPIVIEAGYAL